ncbi:MAG: thioredoxin domain-containing protein [Anaerolineae bacterium]|nr:thioredoxin domain-containing protein [Anaerolineae bacterium]MDW8172459.1 thioredoxin domain-containing protein [Anaerolineae bacterium]
MSDKKRGGKKPPQQNIPVKRPKPSSSAASAAPSSGKPAASSPKSAGESNKQRIEERKHERERQRQRQRTLTIVGLLVTVGLLGLLLVIVRNSPADAPVAEDVAARYEGIPRGSDENGFPRLGSASARIKVEEFSSFECEACRIFHDTIFPALLERVRKGEITFSFIPIAIGSGNPEGAIRSALCADAQGKFWETHDTYFTWAGLYGNNAFTQNRMLAGAQALGYNLDAGCINNERVNNLVSRARAFGIRQTPTVRINGTEVSPTLEDIMAQIDSLLATQGGAPATPVPTTIPAEVTPEVTQSAEATPEAAQSEGATSEVTQAAEATVELPRTEVTEEVTAMPTLVSPTNTASPVPPTSTSTPRPTNTASPVPPTSTSTPRPTNTASPVPPTSTP